MFSYFSDMFYHLLMIISYANNKSDNWKAKHLISALELAFGSTKNSVDIVYFVFVVCHCLSVQNSHQE